MLDGVSGGRFARDLWRKIRRDRVANGAAALAYYLMLSIFPTTIALLSILPYLPVPDLGGAVMQLLHDTLPGPSADLFQSVVESVVSQRHGSLLAFGVLLAVLSASSGLYALMQQLNATYEVAEGRSFLRARGMALLLMLLFLVLIVGAFALVVAGGWMQGELQQRLGWSETLALAFTVLRWLIVAGALLLGFALTYYFGPDVEQDFRFVTAGSILGAAAFVVASLAFKVYVTNFNNYSRAYGSLGAVIVLMLWLYLAGWAILLGSEVNALLEQYDPRGKSQGEKELPRPG